MGAVMKMKWPATVIDFLGASALVLIGGLLGLAAIGFAIGVPLGIIVWCVRFASAV